MTAPRARLPILPLLVVLLSGCGGATAQAGRGHVARPGERVTTPTGLRRGRVLVRGVLAYDVALDANGTLLASVELGTEFALVLRALPGGKELARARLGGAEWDVLDVAVTADGSAVATASLDGTVRVHARDGTPRAAWRLDTGATAVAWSPDGTYLATGADSGVMCLRRAVDGAQLQCVAAHGARVAALAFSPDGTALASAGWDGRTLVWASPSLAVLAERRGAGAVANAVAWSADGTRVAVAEGAAGSWRPSLDPTARVIAWLWQGDSATGTAATGPVNAIAWVGQAVVSASYAGEVAVGTAVLRQSQLLRGLAVAPDGRWLVVAAWTDRKLTKPSLVMIELLYP